MFGTVISFSRGRHRRRKKATPAAGRSGELAGRLASRPAISSRAPVSPNFCPAISSSRSHLPVIPPSQSHLPANQCSPGTMPGRLLPVSMHSLCPGVNSLMKFRPINVSKGTSRGPLSMFRAFFVFRGVQPGNTLRSRCCAGYMEWTSGSVSGVFCCPSVQPGSVSGVFCCRGSSVSTPESKLFSCRGLRRSRGV